MGVKNSIKKIMFTFVVLLMASFITVPVQASHISSLIRTPVSVYVGSSSTIKPKNPAKGEKLKWTSLDSGVVTVSQTGKVTGKKAGTTRVTAKSKSRTYLYTVEVKKKPKQPKINYTTKSIEVGESFSLKLRNIIGSCSWTSSNKKIATIDYSGSILGCSPGTAKISTKYNGVTYSCKVTVKKSSKSLIRKAAPQANECVLKAFEDLDFRLLYDGSVSYAGYFSAGDQSITLRYADDTVYHELGHFLAWIAGNVDKKSEFATIYQEEKGKYTGVRKAYVTQNTSEYFAESYRDYILSNASLKKNRPKTYAYVKNAVQIIQNSPDRITKIKNAYKVIWKNNK